MGQTSIQLQALCSGIISLSSDVDFIVTGMTMDSRQIKPGDLFLACIGEQYDARDFIDEASEAGASGVLCEVRSDSDIREINKFQQDYKIPVIPALHLQEKIGLLANRFYGAPSEKLQVVAVTGTNGKTSCCHFIANALTQQKVSCALIGTAGNGFPDALSTSQLTTPDKVTLHALIAEYLAEGAKALAFEASSHGLSQQRLAGVNVDIGIFTNLTRDHLDYHKDMRHYAQAKRLLFELPSIKTAIINMDDEFGRQLINDFQDKLTVYGFTVEGRQLKNSNIPVISARDIQLTADGLQGYVVTPWGEGQLTSNLLGKFNFSNLLAVLTCLGIMRVPFGQAMDCISKLPGIIGRMEPFGGKNLPLVVVDYAHTSDALEQVLIVLKQHCVGKLWCVFGCGGGRDTGKRPLMGKIAEQYSDYVIVTNDNPRHDEPRSIAQDILNGMEDKQAAILQLDRRKAITYAVEHAAADDIVLIAGKGHEAYQLIGDIKYPFSDQKIVQEVLENNRSKKSCSGLDSLN